MPPQIKISPKNSCQKHDSMLSYTEKMIGCNCVKGIFGTLAAGVLLPVDKCACVKRRQDGLYIL